MTLDDSMIEVQLEDACRELELSDRMTGYILESTRSSNAFVKMLLAGGASHRDCVRMKLEILRGIGLADAKDCGAAPSQERMTP
jgi:hypothetical protein